MAAKHLAIPLFVFGSHCLVAFPGPTDVTSPEGAFLWQTFQLALRGGLGSPTNPAPPNGPVAATPAVLKITELFVDAGIDSIEFRVVQAVPLTGVRILVADTLRYTFPTTPSFNVGDMIVYHAQAVGTDETGGNPTASVDAGATPGYDFWSPGAAITSTDNEIEVTDAAGTHNDYVAYVDGAFGGGQAARVEAHISAGHWTKASGAVATTDLVDSTTDNGGLCMKRRNTGAGTAHTDTNVAGDWSAGACNLGNNENVP